MGRGCRCCSRQILLKDEATGYTIGWSAELGMEKEMGMYLDLDDVVSGHPEAEKQLKELRSVLSEWLLFASDVQPGCAAGADWLEGLRNRTFRHVPPNA